MVMMALKSKILKQTGVLKRKKPRIPGDEGPSLTEFSGYNAKRQEFEIEYDNDAEQLLTDMEFKDTDSDAERELKLRILRIYLKRLDERKRRKDFILDRNLLYPDPFEKDLSHEEREICPRFRVFMQFHSKEEHAELLKTLIEEHQIRTRVQIFRKLELLAATHLLSISNRRKREKLKKMPARPRTVLKLAQVVNSCRGRVILMVN